LRRRWDALLLYFALFAVLYGMRLWEDSQVLTIALSDSVFTDRFRSAINFLMPIPAYLFLDAAGLLHRTAKYVGFGLAPVYVHLTVAVVAFGPAHIYDEINNIVIIAALIVLIAHSFAAGRVNPDFVIIRNGLLVFVVFAVFDNVVDALGRRSRIEPYGFAVFLAALGYVAARQTLQRDEALREIQKELDIARRFRNRFCRGSFPRRRTFAWPRAMCR
jgi:phosphoserine phosphatase RsbU/P